MVLAGVSFAISFVLLILFERFINAISLLVLRLVTGNDADKTTGYASVQMVGAGASFGMSLTASVANTVAGVLTALLNYLLFAVVVSVFFAVLYVIQEYYPELSIELVEYWNAFLGPMIHTIALAPAQLFETVYAATVPVFNAVTWLISQMFYNVIMVGAIRDFQSYKMLGDAFFQLVKSLSINTGDYITSFVYPCEDAMDPQCLAIGPRTFDFITPMQEMRTGATAISQITRGMCMDAAPVVDMVLFPFYDINFAKSVHNLANSVLFLIFQVGSITSQRCKASNYDTINCWPDFSPVFNFLTAGLRNLGKMLDNWFDVSTVIIQAAMGIDTSAADCQKQALSLLPANYSRAVFKGNEITTVGLTEGLYAVTDGT